MTSRKSRKPHLFLPELVEEEAGPWQTVEVEIRDAAVDLQGRKAWVPKARTPAQRLARLHELGHVKYTPRHWRQTLKNSLLYAAENGEEVDPTTVVQISKMLEENRIDWLLWDRHQIDLRPAREVLDWEHMQIPSDPLQALRWTFQLAWTVWASRGLSGSIENPPPVRMVDEATGRFFDACWAVISNHHPGLGTAMVRACLRMYAEPTHGSRDRAAAELATFFPPKIEEPPPPPAKPSEVQAQQEAIEIEQAQEQRRQEDEDAGIGSERVTHGHYEIHDHTTGIRRPSLRIRRRETPQFTGTKLTYPHRYMLDKAVFARRVVTEGGIMIDASGSMQWEQEDLAFLLEKLPAVTVGIYGGVGSTSFARRYHKEGGPLFGRICVLAKRGRFSRYDPRESGFNGDNNVDLEALWLLARWPKPRLWLSDGYVTGGKYVGAHPDPEKNTSHYMRQDGRLIEAVNRFMRANEILRVSSKEDMHQLLQRQRVTLYRSCVNTTGDYAARTVDLYPPGMREQPTLFQL